MYTSSRFAVLSPEVDLASANRIRAIRAKQEKPRTEKPKVSLPTKVQEKCQTKNKQNLAANNKKKSDDSDLQALAFGFGKSKGNKKGGKNNSAGKENQPIKKASKKGKKNSRAVNGSDPNHDDDWRKRDEEFVKSQNERSLREAILQSKLEFEEKKKSEDFKKTDNKKTDNKKTEKEKEKPGAVKGSKNKKKKEKPITISLDQFHSLQSKELANLKDLNLENETTKDHPVHPQKFSEEKFFKDVEEATRRTLDKEHRQEQYKANATKVNHEIQVKKFISEIEKRDFEIQALRLEVDSLRTQLLAVKSRNKKLCEVISFSEMRSKGELVVELEKVTKGRDEFSEEIARLTAELEQERTKVSHLNTELKKLQGKRRNADTSSK